MRPANEKLLERMRALADPDRYKEALAQTRTEAVQQVERILVQYDLMADDPNLREDEREAVLENFEKALHSLEWRVKDIDESLAEFQEGQERGMNRRGRRAAGKAERKIKVLKPNSEGELEPVPSGWDGSED